MRITFTSDGTVFASHPAWRAPQPLPRGRYVYDSGTGEVSRYSYGQGMQGFWTSLGNGFSSIGKWVGNNFGTIATLGAGVYAIHSGLSTGQGQGNAAAAQNAQAQAAANAAAAAQAQAQPVPAFDLGSILPIVLVAVVGYMALRK